MSTEPAEPMEVDERPPSDGNDDRSSSEDDSEPQAPADLMVVSRARRSNAGNRMSTLLAKSAEEEEWGEEWEEAPNEEEFVGDDANEQEDYNLDSSSSEEEDDGADDDAGEKELRKAERQERIKKRKTATNPFTARLAAATRKRVKLDVPSTQSPAPSAPRPKKKSERASWIPTEEDGPTRTSSRRQTVANKQSTLAKLKEKDRRRDDTLAMMKAAEARKAKDEPKALTQAERLAEAARVERVNRKTLHRWEEAEEQRAAERQAKIDALKNRQIEGPVIRYWSGPAIWVDEKIKFTGKGAPNPEELEEKLNKDMTLSTSQSTQPGTDQAELESTQQVPSTAVDQTPTSQDPLSTAMSQSQSQPTPQPQPSQSQSETQIQVQAQELQIPVPPTTQGPVQDASTEAPKTNFQNSIVIAPPQTPEPFLSGMELYAQSNQQPDQNRIDQTPQQRPPMPTSQPELPPNPFVHIPQPPISQPHPSLSDPLLSQNGSIQPSNLLAEFQKPPVPAAPPAPPRRKVVRRALRNLLILSSFPNLDSAPTSTRVRTAASLLKEKDKAALIQLSTALFSWSQADATAFVTAMLNAPKTKKEKEALAKPKKELCAVSNQEARYRDPETGIAYRDSRAFGVLRGVVGGGFVWCGELGCYVGGRAKPMESRGKGFLGMAPAAGVPKRFLEMATKKKTPPQPVEETPAGPAAADSAADASVPAPEGSAPQPVKTEEPATVSV